MIDIYEFFVVLCCFLIGNVGNTPNGSKQSQVENNGVISLQANRSQDANFEQGVLPNRSRVHRGKILQKAYVIYNSIINNFSGLQKL